MAARFLPALQGVFLVLLAAASLGVRAQGVPEYTLKAAFVYNFALFAEWPESAAGENFNVCINLESPMRAAIEEFHDRLVKGRRLLIRPRHNIENTRGCQILFIDRIDRDRWPQVKKGIASDPILTITDDGEIGRDGAMIALSTSEGRIVFDVDGGAARTARIAISSKLLRLARTVK